jgi:hypothetical protein
MNTIHKSYIEYCVSNQKRPESLKAFAEMQEILLSDLQKKYTSFEKLEAEIFAEIWKETQNQLSNDAMFYQYNGREKLLSVYYTWFELLKNQKDFLHFLDKQGGFWSESLDYLMFGNIFSKYLVKPILNTFPPYIMGMQTDFKRFSQNILNNAVGEEVANRFWLNSRYADALWLMTIFLFRFWLKDESNDSEKTDAAIEKALNWFFDVIKPNAWDSGFDLAKFVWQNNFK